MRPFSLLLIPVLALAGCAGEPPAAEERPPDGEMAETIELPVNGFFLPPFGSTVPVRVVATFEVLEGGPIDAWLATGETCRQYGQRSFDATISRLNATSGALEGRFGAADHCLILDNAGFATGEAQPTGPVKLRYAIRVWEEGPA